MANRPGGFALFHTGEIIEFDESSSNYSNFEENLVELTEDDWCYPQFEQYKRVKDTPHCILWSDDYKTELFTPKGKLYLDEGRFVYWRKYIEPHEAKEFIPNWAMISIRADEDGDYFLTFQGNNYV